MSSALDKKLAARLASRESRSQLRRLTLFPPESVDLSSNAYLSLQHIPEVREAYLALLASYAPDEKVPLFGSGGSRLLDGNSLAAESLETEIAAFHRAPAGLIFNSGFDANVGLFSCVPQPGDVIVYDELIHASIHDGMRLSRASRRIAFKHSCIERSGHRGKDTPNEDHLKSLDEVLESLVRGEEHGLRLRQGETSVFVAIEGVYSMDGDVAPLKEAVDCVKRWFPKGNGHVIIDEAHSTGILGPGGRGLVCELGLEDSVFARVHTFGKAMGSSGGKSRNCQLLPVEYCPVYILTD